MRVRKAALSQSENCMLIHVLRILSITDNSARALYFL